MNIHEKALEGIFGDMDNLESKKMFGEPDGDEGTSITITISPKGDMGASTSEDLPADHDVALCKGGCAMHKGGTVPTPELEADISNQHGLPDPEYEKGEMGMAGGGVVAPEAEEGKDLSLPPWLRKKKMPSNK